MKKIKSILAIVMVVAMALSMSVFAYAVDDGTINVAGSAGQTYTAYRLLDIENSTVTDAFRYYLPSNDARLALFGSLSGTTFTPNSSNGAATLFDFSVENGNVYVSVKSGINNDNATLKSFAEAAKAFVAANSIAAADTAVAGDSGAAVLDNLPYGYYLVDSSVGALCVLNTANSTTNITEKNEVPRVTKSAALPANTNPKVGTVVTYTIRIDVKPGAQNYVLHDMVTAGITFNDDIAITVDDEALAAANYTVSKNVAHDFDEDGTNDETHTFDIAFADAYIRNNAGKTIVITYTGTINATAITAKAGNDAALSYGDHPAIDLDPAGENTPSSDPNNPPPVVYTLHSVQILDTDRADGTILPDGEYQLLNSTTPVALVEDGDNLRPANADAGETGSATFVAGNKTIIGLGDGAYSFQETKAPAGYNMVKDPISFTMDGADLKIADNAISEGKLSSEGHGTAVVFEHGAGALFPTTGMSTLAIVSTISVLLAMTGILAFALTKKKEQNTQA